MYLSWLLILLSSILTALLCVSLPLIFGCPLCAKSLVNLGVSELPDRLVSQTFKIAKAAYDSKRNWRVLHDFGIILINFEWVLPHSWTWHSQSFQGSEGSRGRFLSLPQLCWWSLSENQRFANLSGSQGIRDLQIYLGPKVSEICKFIWVPRYQRFANLSGSQGIIRYPSVSHPRNNFDPGVE